jgi:IS5 family transposase
VAAKRSTLKALPEGLVKDLTQQLEKLKAQVRARVEHPFHVIKNLFHYRKTRYRGLAKNLAQLYSLFALANLIIVRRSLLSAEAE